ncbi:endoglucanase 1 [Coniella lustricola]|uniref:cellulase n=1 Tax=Coniella lustricola TaxID=2025994 RepID=A0A2T3AID7_9PEZI|nr:endoglucanase 1 [Coniella lustricola]
MRSSLLLSSLLLGAEATIYWAGVAESGGEFGIYGTPGTGLPGTFGVDYQFINSSAVDVYVDQNKVNLFRVAFLLERMCPLAYGLGAKFNETHFDLYKEAIDHITITKGAYAILDPHNYMRYNDPSAQPYSGSVIGNKTDPAAATTEQFAAFWGELGRRFANNNHVIFGLMNEPHDMPTSLVLENDQAAITAIRKAGARNLVLAPGNGWTGGHAWTEYTGTLGDNAPSSEYIYKITDPANNWAVDIHEYLDVDFSGSHIECTQPYNTTLAPLTAWLKHHQLKAVISEFGGSNTTGCADLLTEALAYMADNEEYIGWSAWAAGPLWGTSAPCCSNSTALGSLEPGSLAADGSPGLYETVWEAVLEPLLPKTMQRKGAATVRGSG